MPPTPGGILTKQLRQREEELNKYNTERITIVENGDKIWKVYLQERIHLKRKNLKKNCVHCVHLTQKKRSCIAIRTTLGIGGSARMVEHGGKEPDFQMEVTGLFSDALSRQADELNVCL